MAIGKNFSEYNIYYLKNVFVSLYIIQIFFETYILILLVALVPVYFYTFLCKTCPLKAAASHTFPVTRVTSGTKRI